MRIPKLPKARQVHEWDRRVPLRVKNANPFSYGFPSATSIPGNSEGIVVPCAPFDDFDGDRRWCICETQAQAIKQLDSYIRDWQKQDEESRCVFYKKKADGSIIGVRCRANCLHCPKLIDPNDPERPTYEYQRTGNPISLDFKYDEDDPEESEHDIADTDGETPEEYCERLEEERRVEELIATRDELDQQIIRLLLEDSTRSNEDLHKLIGAPKRTISYRKVRLQEWVREVFKK